MLHRTLGIYRRVLLAKASVRIPCRRYTFPAARLHPMIEGFSRTLQQPRFAVSPDDIQILSKPTQFYILLLEMIRRAQTRIFISSLYIGSNESEFVSTLAEALRNKPKLQIHMLFDLNRSTRPGPHNTAKLLIPLVHDPSLRGILAKLIPPRFNEGWGTWHAKIYGVDDEVMISGANLNKSYFTDRQDRYIHFTNQQNLSQYCFDFIEAVSTVSFELQPPVSSAPIGPYSFRDGGYEISWPTPELHPHEIHNKAELALSTLQATYHKSAPEPFDPTKVLMFPLIQAGQFNIRDEEHTLKLLFDHVNAISETPTAQGRPLFDLTSGYFGLYEEYQILILRSSNVDCRIVAASPKANGFYGSRGVSGRIPEGYTLLEQRFMKAVKRAGRESSGSTGSRGVQLNEWEKDGWTYHAKGIWLSPSANSPPMLTLFGSTNLNSRSAHIDTELSFLMVVPSTDTRSSASSSSSASILRQQLADEIQGLRAHSTPWKGAHRNVRLGTKILVGLVGGML
ncbi:hypothetical protein B0H10DRAFT_2175788 [Mycena sp. CBHHK59/15]|nr:hypothetical protein B0H10DRAFT_2175788 [Mycena sp. CBHHK59/15]